MVIFDYQKICSKLLENLPKKQKEIILRRFALTGGKRETLESIGKDFSLTRERVRQIEQDGISKITPDLKKYQATFQYFQDQLKATGNLRKEEILLSHLGKGKYQPQVFFLLTLNEPFERFTQNDEFHSFWTINQKSSETAQKIIKSFYEKLNKTNQPLRLADYRIPANLNISAKVVEYFLEISKIIQKNQDGFFGLKDWPEINPRSIKDKTFLVLKNAGKPLHFRQVARNIGSDILPQTVHNELIRDPRFVLVGRGLYALKQWGFKEGDVKDIILQVLKENGQPMSKDDILDKVSQQRLVKKNTILVNLGNKKHFSKTADGKYSAR